MPAVTSPPDQTLALREIAEEAGLRRVHLLAWRDLDDAEAGGSEVHADTVAAQWAEAGIEVTMRTSFAAGHPPEAVRNGYRVVRRGNRYVVFPQAAVEEARQQDARDGLIEIWNGMPFLSPLWAKGPRAVWLHHVHAEMWQMMLPEPVASMGAFLERRLAPPLYRRTPIVTLAESSRRELIDHLGFRRDLVTVVPPGIDPSFTPSGEKSPSPLVVAVGRLTPVKRFHLLIDAVVPLKARHPDLEVVIVGEGFERPMLEDRIAAAGAWEWIKLPGRVDHDAVVDLYRRAWVLAASSAREGWGMTLTEAAACATPSVATRISGHEDAMVDGETGLLAEPVDLGDALNKVLADGELRRAMSAAARRHADRFTWAATARGTLEVLAADARRRRR